MANAADRGLVRALTLLPAVALIIANVIGTGVFVKARVMTCNVGSPELVLTVWLVAGLLSLAGALVYAELAAMMPRPGGEFHFLGAAFGPRWAFLYGWTRTISLGASAAAVAILATVFLNDLTGGALPAWAMFSLPLVLIAVATAINLATVRTNGHATTALSTVKVGLVLLVGVGAFVLASGNWGNFSLSGSEGSCAGVPESARLGVGGFGAAMLGALWGYNGWSLLVAMGGEVRDPERTLPRALILGTLTVIGLYLVINTAYFYVLTPVEVASVAENSSVAYEAASRFLGPVFAVIMSTCLVISAYGTLHTTMLGGPRVPYTIASVGFLPGSFARLSSRGVPVVAVIAIGLWSIVLAATGTFDILTDMYIFILWVFYGLNGIALILLRRRHPGVHRPYRVWGYPFVPALFLIVTVYLLVNTIVVTPWRAAAGLGLIIIGIPMYRYYLNRMEGAPPSEWLGADDDPSTSQTR